MTPVTKAVAALAASLLAAACQTSAADGRRATLETADASAMATITETISRALDRARIALGPGDLTKDSTISVLPRPPGPHDTASPARPTYFDLMIGDDGGCYLKRRDTGETFPLARVIKCRAAK